MMGSKERQFVPLMYVSLEELVPHDHFYRQLERTLDLSFVREFVQTTYASRGRPSIDPVVFFKLQLVLFFEGLRSERQLMRHAADRLSIRWFLGYDLNEPLPDHSSLTKIRTRYGIEVFRRFFEAIVEQCQHAGLIWGRELFFDGTKVAANAGKESVRRRFAVEAHLNSLFETEAVEPVDEAEQHNAQEELADSDPPVQLPVALSPAAYEELCQHNAERHDWIEEEGAQDRCVKGRNYQRIADYQVSTTDPDATIMHSKGGLDLGYHTHYVVDGGKARIIVAALVTPSEVMDNQPMLDLLWRTRFRWKLWPRHVTGDKKYGTEENLVAIEDQGIRAYIPIPDMDHRTEFFSSKEFQYDAERDIYVCPAGIELHFAPWHSTERSRRYRAYAKDCNHYPRHPRSVPPVHKDAASAAASMRRCWNECVPINQPNPTKKPYASVRSGWNHSLQKAKTGMACAAFACVGSGESTVRHSCEQRDKISSDSSKSEDGDGILVQQKPFLPSFWLHIGG